MLRENTTVESFLKNATEEEDACYNILAKKNESYVKSRL